MSWMASLSIEERRHAGILASSSIQEEPEQEIPAEQATPMVEAPEEEETLYYPTERDYRDMRADEAWEPTEPQPSQAAPKAFPKAFQAAEPPPGHEGQGAGRLGVYITKYGQKYHVFKECQTLTSSLLRASPPCHQCTPDLNRIRRGDPIWCKGWGEIHHRGDLQRPGCTTLLDKKYDVCVLCAQEMRQQGLNL